MGRSAEERRAELVELYKELNDQHGCPLAGTRTHVVFGMGAGTLEWWIADSAPGGWVKFKASNGGKDQSLTRAVDGNATAAFVLHKTLNPSTPASPGTRSNGTAF